MIIGGDVVQKALAQTTGGWLTPTCFSFGWVACSFSMLVSVLGDGRLLPLPDCDVKVINLQSRYRRENRNWVIGRLLRDHQIRMESSHTFEDAALRIAVFDAQAPPPKRHIFWPRDTIEIVWFIVALLQFIIAVTPIGIHRQWLPLLITAAGTIAVQVTGLLPQ
jgi:hypothetical protein